MVKPTVKSRVRVDASRLDKLSAALRKASSLEIAVGYPATADGVGQPWYDDGSSIIDVALRNNYGLGVPARPFMDAARPEMQKLYRTEMAKLVKRLEAGNIDIAEAYEALGARAAEEVRRAIFDKDWTPNAPQTIKRKGSDRPLVDTGEMARRATWHVRPK